MPATLSRQVGQTFVVTPHPLDVNGTPVPLTGHNVTHVSSDVSIAPVTADGIGTARAVGTAVITTTVDGKSDTTTITVTALPGTPTIAFSNAPLLLAVAGYVAAWLSGLAVAVHRDIYGAPTGLAPTYTSSRPSVATIDPATGVVTPVSAGWTRITATAGGISTTQLVVVYSNDVRVMTELTGGDAKWRFTFDPRFNLSQSGGLLTSLSDARDPGSVTALGGFGSPAPAISGAGANLCLQTDGTQNYCETATSPQFDPSQPMELCAIVDSLVAGTANRYPVLMGDVAVDYTAIGGGTSIKNESTGFGGGAVPPGGEGITAGTPWAPGTRRAIIATRGLMVNDGDNATYQLAEYCDVPPRLRGTHATDPQAQSGSHPLAQNATTARLWVGATGVGSNYNAAKLYFVGARVSNTPMTPVQRAAWETFAASRGAVADTSVTKSIYFIGDSMTVGTGATTPLTGGWVSLLMTNGHWAGWDWARNAANGRTLKHMLANADSKIIPYSHASRTKNIAVLFAGVNDIFLTNTPAAVIIDDHVQMIRLLAAAGFTPVFCTMTNRTTNSGAQNAAKDAFNTAMRAMLPDLQALYGCGMIDFAADARLDVVATPANAADAVHWNDLGHPIAAAVAEAVLAGFR